MIFLLNFESEEIFWRKMSTKYFTTSEGLKETLENYGVAIIPSVLSGEECEQMADGMWNYLEFITSEFETPMSRYDQETWREMGKLLPLKNMLLQRWGVGHSQFVWNLREKKKVVDIFSNFWGVKNEELVVSFDGASFHMPPEVTKRGWEIGNLPLHTDQSYTRNEFECAQSWITAFDVNKGDPTLAILEGSHKFHGEFAKRFGKKDKSDWYKLEKEDKRFYIEEKGCELKFIECPAGSIVFWDSRTIHCGKGAEKYREKQNFRCVVYLCYMPRNKTDNKIIRKRIKAFEELRMTNHWANKPKLFSKIPQTYGAELPKVLEIPRPILGELGKKLVGY